MNLYNLTIRIIFMSQITIGILGNFSLIFYYLILYYRQCTLKPTDLILLHIMAANAVIILSLGVPNTMSAFGLKQFVNDFACKLLLYIQGFGRSVSISTTCLLSVFQAMTISPRESCWKGHKARAANYICCSTSLLWVLHMLIHSIFFVYTFIKRNSKNVTREQEFGFCSIVGQEEISESLYVALVVCPEVLFSVLITWSSTSMIVILYRHKQRVQHIHSFHSSSRNSPESRATQNILALEFYFMVFYAFSSILRGCITFSHNQYLWLVKITPLVSLCFPTFAPFVFISHYSIASRLCLA
ncbi:vomeronasal type-1 receptor 2-like [Arvicanthis niloticus]|uniref:vomeronasal type-1 receptor 2-like n=1 Tax=Arvicanthis niloticus TaxID=61156 RepID=UPI001485D77B|nr:vomeronasal type-1 receptor 2-like [Arvicanthis niloticus]